VPQSVHEQVGVLAAVESEGHFFEVGLQMLCAQLVPASAQTALEQREGGLNRIGVRVPANVFFLAVRDRFMRESRSLGNLLVRGELIGEEHVHILSSIVLEKLFENATSDRFGVEQSQLSVALTNADDRALLGATAAFFLGLSLAADVGFIHLDLAAQHGFVAFRHRRTDSVAEVPSGFIADSQCPLNLASRHALLGFTEQQGSDEPFGQGQVGVVENRSNGHAELVVALPAIVESLFGFKFDGFHAATRATDAFGPAQTSQQLPALLIGREQRVYVN